jgi:polyhydroxybutyrate depolymerase
MRRLLLTLVSLLLASLGARAAGDDTRLRSGSFEHQGQTRSFVFYLPAPARGSVPLVLALHGFGGSGRNVLQQGRWVDKAQAEGFALLAPDGSLQNADRRESFLANPRSWNSGPTTGSPASESGVDDIGFLRALLGQFVAAQGIDPRRVYATGFSNGAAMAFRVGAELPELVAAIAPVSNALLVPVRELKPPVSLLLIWGDADPLNPIQGGRLRREGGRVDRPAGATSLAQWARALNCPPSVTQDMAPGVRRQRHLGCAADSAAEFITVQGLAHQWPGGKEYLRAISGPGSNLISATDLIWDFFRSHARP